MSRRHVAAVSVVAALSLSAVRAQIPVLHRFDGPSPGVRSGIAVSGAGDVDADGFADVIVGATDGSAISPLIGSASVFSGRDGRSLHTFSATNPGDAFGAAVAGAGDVDGDGHDDLVVGARYDSTRATFAGSVRVFSGRDGRLLYEFHGDGSGDRLGVSVDGAGDVDGDGSDDVIAGAYFANHNGFWSGSARVWSGRTGRVLWTFHGDGEFQFFGAAVAGAGDVDGDGRADVVVGAYGDDTRAANGGMVRVLSGRDGRVLHTLFGEVPQGRFGSAVDGVGDMNRDGHDDVIVGAWMADAANGQGSGTARVFSGRDGSILYTFLGDDPADHFGFAVAGAGDVDGDGTPDAVVGAYFDSDNGVASGSARILSGADGETIATFRGDSQDDRFGIAVGGAGDTNGDGFADLVVGAPGDDDAGPEAGSARVFAVCGAERYGAASGSSPLLSLRWSPGPDRAASGQLELRGAGAFAAGGLALSLGEASLQIGPLTVLVDTAPGRWLFVPLVYDGAGRASLPLELREPALAGTVIFGQSVDVGTRSLSNGLRLLFCR